MKRKMGTFYADFIVANHNHRDRKVEVRKALVDSGSEATWIAADTLKKIGVLPEKKDLIFVMANGQEVTRQVGFAVIYAGGVHTTDEVVFALEGDMQILGARTLEGLNLTIHPRKKILAPAGPRLAGLTVGQQAGEKPPTVVDHSCSRLNRPAPAASGSLARLANPNDALVDAVGAFRRSRKAARCKRINRMPLRWPTLIRPGFP